MNDDADPELTVLWAHPLVAELMAERAPARGDLHTCEDVLAALHEFGRVNVELRDDGFDAQGLPRPRYLCTATLREGAEGTADGRGPTLEHAALRCLVEILEELHALTGSTLGRFDALLAGMARVSADVDRGVAELQTFLADA